MAKKITAVRNVETSPKPGIYSFRVKNVARAYYKPGPKSKIPACPMATLTLELWDGESHAGELTHKLHLCERMQQLLSEFFASIGQRNNCEPYAMDWGKVPGASGKCKVYHHTYTDKDGQAKSFPQIKRFIAPVARKTRNAETEQAQAKASITIEAETARQIEWIWEQTGMKKELLLRRA